ncbi:hypothetical protein [Comamonas sp. C24C]
MPEAMAPPIHEIWRAASDNYFRSWFSDENLGDGALPASQGAGNAPRRISKGIHLFAANNEKDLLIEAH